MTLEPGDIIATGTPSGVGDARQPQVFLKPGDVVQVEIAELGVLEIRLFHKYCLYVHLDKTFLSLYSGSMEEQIIQNEEPKRAGSTSGSALDVPAPMVERAFRLI